MQARPFLSLAGLGWFGDLRGGVAQRSNRLGRRFEYVEQCSNARVALRAMQCLSLQDKKAKHRELASTNILGISGWCLGVARIRGRHGLARLPKVHSTAAGVVAEARAAAR